MRIKDLLSDSSAHRHPPDLHTGLDSERPPAVSVGGIHQSIFQRVAAVPHIFLTAGVLAIATLLRVLLTPVFGSGYTFITFYPATMFSTVIAGWRYGLATAVAAAFLSVLLFIDPFRNFEHAAALGVFLVIDGLMIVIADWTWRARRQLELSSNPRRVRVLQWPWSCP